VASHLLGLPLRREVCPVLWAEAKAEIGRRAADPVQERCRREDWVPPTWGNPRGWLWA
jgi:hypothetical protein